MAYACPIWNVAFVAQLLKLLRVQDQVFPATDNSPRRIPIRDLHVAFGVAYIYV
jgi:hypothetical protein